MFHVGIGARTPVTHLKESDQHIDIRRWESRFSSDPLIFNPVTAQDSLSKNIPFPSRSCEVKLFRDFAGLLEGVPFDILPTQRGCRILILGIPVSVSLESVMDGVIEDVQFYSELSRSDTRDSRDFDRSALVVFKTQSSADKFFRDWHIQFFDAGSTIGPVCYLAFVDKLFVYPVQSQAFQSMLPVGSQQIPSCPFCIERIDVNVSGLVTSRRGWLSSGIVCSKSCVACSNLSKESLQCCSDSDSRFWLCLLCGNVGCGRYAKGHAESHSKISNHRLSLEISTGRIWDYIGDIFVHRRIVSQPSAPILDLPERVDNSALSVHPQVSFEEDIRELDSTMARQLSYERSKYEEACTQLKALGTSRVHEEEVLLSKELAQEEELRESIDESFREKDILSSRLRQLTTTIRSKENRIAKLKQTTKESIDKLKRLRANLDDSLFGIPKNKLDELERLQQQVQELRNKVSSM